MKKQNFSDNKMIDFVYFIEDFVLHWILCDSDRY